MKMFLLSVIESIAGILLSGFAIFKLSSVSEENRTRITDVAREIKDVTIKKQAENDLAEIREKNGDIATIFLLIQCFVVSMAFSFRNGMMKERSSWMLSLLVVAASIALMGGVWYIIDKLSREPKLSSLEKTLDTLETMANNEDRNQAAFDALALGTIENLAREEEKKSRMRLPVCLSLIILDFLIAFAFRQGENANVFFDLIAYTSALPVLLLLFDLEVNIRYIIKHIIEYKKYGKRSKNEWISYAWALGILSDSRVIKGIFAFGIMDAIAMICTSPIVTGNDFGNPMGSTPIKFALTMISFVYLFVLSLISLRK